MPVPGAEAHEAVFRLISPVHPTERLPQEFAGLENGYYGSHYFLMDDFLKALRSNLLPPNHIWDAARYNVPGLIAHESALRDGEWLPVPDFGPPPRHWELLYTAT